MSFWPGDWRHRARCRDTDPELFFPLGLGAEAEAQEQEAIAVCARCPVRSECLDWALDNNEAGVWGGLGEGERRLIRRGKRSRERAS